jgi:hypothetical protein
MFVVMYNMHAIFFNSCMPHPAAGVKSRDEILSEFLSNFERANEPDGIVSPAEFLRYYNQIRYDAGGIAAASGN